MIAEDLAGQAHAGQTFGREPLDFGGGVRRRFPLDEFHPACGAARVSTARVKNVNLRVLLDREHEPLVGGDSECAISFDSELWHLPIVREQAYLSSGPQVQIRSAE